MGSRRPIAMSQVGPNLFKERPLDGIENEHDYIPGIDIDILTAKAIGTSGVILG